MENLKPTINFKSVYDNLVHEGVQYITQNPTIKTLVVGMSGGIDSTLTAAVSQDISLTTGVSIHGHIMPIVSNTPEETFRGIIAASHYCTLHEVYDFSDAFNSLIKHLEPLLSKRFLAGEQITLNEKIRLGNIKARIRMIHLYNQAHKHNGLVLSTDNFTELMLGFWTLHGDVGDFGLIQNLWKTEVYGLAEYIGGDCFEAAHVRPTDGLGITESDLDQLLPGWTGNDYQQGYRMVDEILLDHLTGGNIFNPDHPVVQRCKTTKFKRENPVNVPRYLTILT